jgi:sialate O-acetylesterase
MVLQRDVPDTIFGTATPGSLIEVDLAGQSSTVQADTDGRWITKLRPMPAGGPYEMKVTGDGTVLFKDVMVGEVWVASGQSNMEFREENAEDFSRAKSEAVPAVRMFTVGHKSSEDPESDIAGNWQVASSFGIGYFSAVAYSFAAEVQRRLHVPVGIINSSWGGTAAEAWTSRDGLESNASTRPMIDAYLESLRNYPDVREKYQKELADWNADRVDKVNVGVTKGWAAESTDVSDWKPVTLPTTIKEIEGRQVNGAFWFRRTFELPSSMTGKTLLLELGPIDNYDRAYINGVQVGFSDSEVPNAWVTPRSYPVASSLLHEGTNTVAVRVFSSAGVGGFTGTAQQMVLRQYDKLGDAVPIDGSWEYKPERIAQPEGPPPTPPVGPGNARAPGGLFNGMVAPLIPFTIKGVIWYQGEANTSRAFEYRSLFTTLIQDWRAKWGEGSFPFYFVQLPNFLPKSSDPGESAWAELREAQSFALTLPATGMATTIDLGDPNDIHPKNKREVGRRLAIDVLHDVYHNFAEVAASPYVKTVHVNDDEVWVRFESTGGKLKTTDERPPVGFAIAGADHKFHWAEGRIRGDWVILSSKDVPKPVAVRYAWADNPDVNLVGLTGLPATPYRSDDWSAAAVESK